MSRPAASAATSWWSDRATGRNGPCMTVSDKAGSLACAAGSRVLPVFWAISGKMGAQPVDLLVVWRPWAENGTRRQDAAAGGEDRCFHPRRAAGCPDAGRRAARCRAAPAARTGRGGAFGQACGAPPHRARPAADVRFAEVPVPAPRQARAGSSDREHRRRHHRRRPARDFRPGGTGHGPDPEPRKPQNAPTARNRAKPGSWPLRSRSRPARPCTGCRRKRSCSMARR